MNAPAQTVRQRILAAIEAGGPSGATQPDIVERTRVDRHHVSVAMTRMKRELVCLGSRPTRYFLDQATADAYMPVFLAEREARALQVKANERARIDRRYAREREMRASMPKPPRKTRSDKGISKRPKLEKNAPLYVTLKPAHKHPPRKETVIVTPNNVKRTVWLTPPDRYAVIGPVPKVFSALRPGQYLDGGTL